MSKADIFRRLPPLFTPWFELKMAKILQQGGGNSLRSEREARTLVEIADALLSGATLQSLMLVLGRLKALTEAHGRDGSWATAQHYEVTETEGLGILSQRDRTNALRGQRDAQRVARGGALPPRVS